MYVASDTYWLPKAGNSDGEYEDAFCIEGEPAAHRTVFRCAIADGATETSFSGLWAAMLVRSYCCSPQKGRDLHDEVPRLQANWREQVGRKPLPWYAEQKALQGAFAALLGLTVMAGAMGEIGGRWEVLAIGDSCLFHVRGAEFIGAFPINHAEAFGNRPALLSSNDGANSGLAEQQACAVGAWESGDTFYLMTDALAHWFLTRIEQGDTLRPLPGRLEQSEFADWIADLRRVGELRNDDVTLLRVHVT